MKIFGELCVFSLIYIYVAVCSLSAVRCLIIVCFCLVKVKYPRYGPTWPRGVQEVRAPRFLDTRHMKVVSLSPLGTGHLYPQEYHFFWTCRMLRKSQVTRPGIDPGTVRLVAQRLNHYATPGPLFLLVIFKLL